MQADYQSRKTSRSGSVPEYPAREQNTLIAAESPAGSREASAETRAVTLRPISSAAAFSRARTRPLARLRQFDRLLAVERGFFSEKALINQR